MAIFVDDTTKVVCMRCARSMPNEIWQMNNHLGAFFVCPDCAALIANQRGELPLGGGTSMTGPSRKMIGSIPRRVDVDIETTRRPLFDPLQVEVEIRGKKR